MSPHHRAERHGLPAGGLRRHSGLLPAGRGGDRRGHADLLPDGESARRRGGHLRPAAPAVSVGRPGGLPALHRRGVSLNRNEIGLRGGKFECIFIRKPKKLSGYFRLLEAFKQKDYSWNRDIVYIQTSNIKIEINEKVPWTVDGEYAGNMDKIYIENCHEAIELAICEQSKETERNTNVKKSHRK